MAHSNRPSVNFLEAANYNSYRSVWGKSRELFYRSLTGGRMMAVSVQTRPTLTIATPEEVFPVPFSLTGSPSRNYDVTADGQRFLMLREAGDAEGTSAPTIIVVQNWHEELKRLVPVD